MVRLFENSGDCSESRGEIVRRLQRMDKLGIEDDFEEMEWAEVEHCIWEE